MKNFFAKKIFTKRNLMVVLLAMMDVLLVVGCSFLALLVRFDFGDVPEEMIKNVVSFLPFDAILLVAIFAILGLYTSIWAYASVTELLRLVGGVLVFEILSFVTQTALSDGGWPKSFYILQFTFLVFTTGGMRFFNRVRMTLKKRLMNHKRTIRTLLVGGGEAGMMLIREIFNNSQDFDNRIVCIVDDDKRKFGKKIAGIPIVGTRKDVKAAVAKYNVEEIIIAVPSASKKEIQQIVEECQKTDCKIKILPKIAMSMDADCMQAVRPLSYEDFLGRDEIVVDVDQIQEHMTGKTVLVTGGGGSIGSELCRQIAKINPTQLIILDIYENNAYDIQQELLRNVPGLNLVTIIRSVRDYDGMEKVFAQYHPEIVFHAAAHKHVPLMEFSPNEAVKNNVLGTWNVCALAEKYKCARMVLISSDKAVRPTNVMGATKRLCEMIVQAYARKGSGTEFVAVRFGNVLGSNGSVIPLFLKQIEAGGPVTVTHKDMTRFFMTIPEAVSLILQAGVYAEGGEIFILDMGKPVKIYELAEKLIRMKGYEPGEEIEIKVTGLRPGEKIAEELLMEEEGLKSTPNKLIHIGKPIKMDDKKFFKELQRLVDTAEKNDPEIKTEVAAMVGTYKIDRR